MNCILNKIHNCCPGLSFLGVGSVGSIDTANTLHANIAYIENIRIDRYIDSFLCI